ncbi:HNH endonuclease [Micromonospora ureilytica]|uniref:HNH endonuclease n=1 Tax=Micromonospora ureilytica TaxID=709868 RepID=UPI00403A6A5B
MVNAHRRDWVACNRDKIAAQNKDYRLRYPEKFLYYQQNRARLLAEHPDRKPYGLREWEALKRRHGYRCVYCGERPEKLEQDHVVPVSRGGRHAIANILPACKPCNLSKSDYLLVEWRRELAAGDLPIRSAAR